MVSLLLPAMQNARAAGSRQEIDSQPPGDRRRIAQLPRHSRPFPPNSSHGTGQENNPLLASRDPAVSRRIIIYTLYHFDEPWDSENNLKVLKQMRRFSEIRTSQKNLTNSSYFALTGPDTAIRDGREGTKIRDITDGTSNT